MGFNDAFTWMIVAYFVWYDGRAIAFFFFFPTSQALPCLYTQVLAIYCVYRTRAGTGTVPALLYINRKTIPHTENQSKYKAASYRPEIFKLL